MAKKQKVALLTGITGQDGAYLASLLLAKGYIVHGIKRRASMLNTKRIDHLYQDPHTDKPSLILHYGDLCDSTTIIRLMSEIKPDEVYNLGAQSHVGVSFETPEYTANVSAVGALRFLEAIRMLNLTKTTKFYQASTSEMFGKVAECPQNENTPFHPRSPYGVAKVYAYWITRNYREAFGMKTYNGILFNHESPLRGETFVTRKVTRTVVRIAEGLEDCLYVGNLDAKRDWGHAREYVLGMWQMVQNDRPDDYVLATGQCYTVRHFISRAFYFAGIDVEFRGKGDNEVAVDKSTGKVVVKIDNRYKRPAEVDLLQGDASKAHRDFGWKASVTLDEICEEMVAADLYRIHQRLGKANRSDPAVEELAHLPGGFLPWYKGSMKDSA